MKYFMIIWEPKDSNYDDFLSDNAKKNKLQQIAGVPDNSLEKSISEIGQNCKFIATSLPNVIFYKTDSCTLTEEAITVWLKKVVNLELFRRRCVYIKSVASPYSIPE